MARAVICTGGLLVFGFLMRLVGGECWLAGPSRYGGYHSAPFTGRDVVSFALGLGILFAFLAPFVGKAKGLSLEW